jgi:hypothetical protein
MKINEVITESNTIPKDQLAATPGMKKHPALDNSSPYGAYTFAAKFMPGAGTGTYDHIPNKEGPVGQSLVTVAYSDADHAIIDQAEAAFGTKSVRLSPNGSAEDTTIHKTSPHRKVGNIQRVVKVDNEK